MTAVLLALGASLVWGVADFTGPWKARTLGTMPVLFWAQLGGLASITIGVALVANDPPDDPAVLWAIPAAFSGMLGLYAFYRGMQIGMMSVVAPHSTTAASTAGWLWPTIIGPQEPT